MTTQETRLARLEERVETIREDIHEIRSDIRELKEFTWEAHAGLTRTEKIALAAASSALIGSAAGVIALLTGGP
jgi:hypothetical protein